MEPNSELERSLDEDERIAFTFKQQYPHLHLGDLLIGRVIAEYASIAQNLMQFLKPNPQFLTPVVTTLVIVIVAFAVALATSKLALFIVAALLVIALLPLYGFMLKWCERLTFALTNKRLVCWNDASSKIEWSMALDQVSDIEVMDSTGGFPSVRFDLKDRRSITVANVERAFDIKMLADTHR